MFLPDLIKMLLICELVYFLSTTFPSEVYDYNFCLKCSFSSLSLSVSGLTILNERAAQCQSALGKQQRGRMAKPSMRLSTCLIPTKERALKYRSLLVSVIIFNSTWAKKKIQNKPESLSCFVSASVKRYLVAREKNHLYCFKAVHNVHKCLVLATKCDLSCQGMWSRTASVCHLTPKCPTLICSRVCWTCNIPNEIKTVFWDSRFSQ